MLVRSLAIVAIACLTLGAGGHADKVKVTVVTIMASEEGDTVDPRLKAIAAEVRTRNPGLKSFRLQAMASRSLAPEEKATFDLVDDKQARVEVRRRPGADNRVELAVTAPDQGEIVYRTVFGKFLPIVTRYQSKNQERLIVALSVQP